LAATDEAEHYFERAAELSEDPVIEAVLLERAGVQASALHFWMEGADRGLIPATPRFNSSRR